MYPPILESQRPSVPEGIPFRSVGTAPAVNFGIRLQMPRTLSTIALPGHVQILIRRQLTLESMARPGNFSPDREVIYLPYSAIVTDPDGRFATITLTHVHMKPFLAGELHENHENKSITGEGQMYTIQVRFGKNALWGSNTREFAGWRADQTAQSAFGEWSNAQRVFVFAGDQDQIFPRPVVINDIRAAFSWRYAPVSVDPLAHARLSYSYTFNGETFSESKTVPFTSEVGQAANSVLGAAGDVLLNIARIVPITCVLTLVTVNNTVFPHIVSYPPSEGVPTFENQIGPIDPPERFSTSRISFLTPKGDEVEDGVIIIKLESADEIPAGRIVRLFRIDLSNLQIVQIEEFQIESTKIFEEQIRDYTVEMGRKYAYVGIIYSPQILRPAGMWRHPDQPWILGDLNGDGIADGEDVRALARVLLGHSRIPGDYRGHPVDFNGDNILTSADATHLARAIGGGHIPPHNGTTPSWWKNTPTMVLGDFNGDGVFNAQDIADYTAFFTFVEGEERYKVPDSYNGHPFFFTEESPLFALGVNWEAQRDELQNFLTTGTVPAGLQRYVNDIGEESISNEQVLFSFDSILGLFTDGLAQSGTNATVAVTPYRGITRNMNFHGISFLTTRLNQLRLHGNVTVRNFNRVVNDQITQTIGGQYPFVARTGQSNHRTLAINGLISIAFDPTRTFLNLVKEGRQNWWNGDLRISRGYTTLIDENDNKKILHESEIIVRSEELFPGGLISNNIRRIEDREGNIKMMQTPAFPEADIESSRTEGTLGPHTTFESTGPYTTIPRRQNFGRDTTFAGDITSSSDFIYIERRFREEVMKWLTDGKPKLFRSETEGNLIVVVTGVSFSPFNSTRQNYTFSATLTEIAEYNLENLILYDLVPSSFNGTFIEADDFINDPFGVISQKQFRFWDSGVRDWGGPVIPRG